jgi:hypothetical protein
MKRLITLLLMFLALAVGATSVSIDVGTEKTKHQTVLKKADCETPVIITEASQEVRCSTLQSYEFNYLQPSKFEFKAYKAHIMPANWRYSKRVKNHKINSKPKASNLLMRPSWNI